jgi:hypothetical protein
MAIRKTNGPPPNPQMDQAARQLGRHLARAALREVFTDPKTQQTDKSLTDTINGYFGGHVSYGADGYEGIHNDSSRTSLKKQDRSLTQAINNAFGGHLSYEHWNRGMSDKQLHAATNADQNLNDTINKLTGQTVVTGPGMPSTQDQAKAIDDIIAKTFGTSSGTAPALPDFSKNTTPTVDPLPAPTANIDVDDLLKKLSS